MKKIVLAGLAIGLFIYGVLGSSNAQALTIYTDLASFNAASGATTVYDFEADTAGWIKPESYGTNADGYSDFGDFTIDATGSGIYSAAVRQISGNNDIFFNTMSNAGSLDVIFDQDITAFGFNWIAEGNDTHDISTFSLLGTTWDLGIPGASGFFGVVETEGIFSAGTAFSFGQNSSNWSGLSFDNITYSSPSSAPAPVPEPATMLLFGTGLAGLISTRVRRKKK